MQEVSRTEPFIINSSDMTEHLLCATHRGKALGNNIGAYSLVKNKQVKKPINR